MKSKLKLPNELSPETKGFMRDVMQELTRNKALRNVDYGVLRMLAISYDLYFKSYLTVCQNGLIVPNGDKMISNPATDTMQKAYIQTVKFLTEYGVTLKSSEKIKTLNPEVDADNPLAKFLNGDI